jgi:dihydropteroate synthase
MRYEQKIRLVNIRSQTDALDILRQIGVDEPYGIEAMMPKIFNYNVLLEEIECKVANILKQEMLSLGGDVAVNRGTISCSVDKTDALIMGTLKQILRLCEKIASQPFGLKSLSERLSSILSSIYKKKYILKTSRRQIDVNDRTSVMGILNVTPDSFSDGGRFKTESMAVDCAIQMVEDGADIIDVGGESSRPGAETVPAEEEMKRVIPVIKKLSSEIKTPISIDTTKAEVARAAIDAGAEIVNDISAMRFDAEMSEVVRNTGVAVILMHMRGTPKDMQLGEIVYKSLRGDIIRFLREEIDKATMNGISLDRMIIDPGIGFGKTATDCMKILKYLSEFEILERPILTGVSRKSFIGNILDDKPEGRLEGTAAAVTIAIMNGSRIVRVHDVKQIKKVINVADAIARS